MKVRTVTGPVVVLPEKTTGKTIYYYQGAVLPDGLNEDRVADVIANGLVTETDGPDEPAGDESDPESDPDQVPDGTADEVLAWVGEDKDRAERALVTENAREKPRSTLVTQLQKLALA